jgi:predicted acyltransferase
MLLGAFYWMVDVKKWRFWCQPFVWVGMNPLTLYLLNELVGGYDGLALRITGGPVQGFLDAHAGNGIGYLVVALTSLLLLFWFAHFLYKRKIFIRL